MNVARRIRRRVEAETFMPRPETPEKKTISIGVTEFRFEESITGFIDRADKAMFISKQKGRNRITMLAQ